MHLAKNQRQWQKPSHVFEHAVNCPEENHFRNMHHLTLVKPPNSRNISLFYQLYLFRFTPQHSKNEVKRNFIFQIVSKKKMSQLTRNKSIFNQRKYHLNVPGYAKKRKTNKYNIIFKNIMSSHFIIFYRKKYPQKTYVFP